MTCEAVTIINRASTTAYDAIVLVLTVMRTVGFSRDGVRLRVRDGIMPLLLRDGKCALPDIYSHSLI